MAESCSSPLGTRETEGAYPPSAQVLTVQGCLPHAGWEDFTEAQDGGLGEVTQNI